MRILVCGGRNFGHVVRTVGNPDNEPPETQIRLKQYKSIHRILSNLICLHSKNYSETDNWLPSDIVIITGAAPGADSAASDFAIISFCQLKEYPADWKKYGVRAGFVRNRQMLEEGKPDLVVAFPGGTGTAMMVKLAKAAGVKVLEFKGD